VTNQRLTLSALVRAQNARSDDWQFGGAAMWEREGPRRPEREGRSDRTGQSHLKAVDSCSWLMASQMVDHKKHEALRNLNK